MLHLERLDTYETSLQNVQHITRVIKHTPFVTLSHPQSVSWKSIHTRNTLPDWSSKYQN